MVIRSSLAVVAAVFLVLLGSSAVAAGELPSTTQSELDGHRSMWNEAGLSDYSYRMQRICFCTPAYVAPGLVVVRGGAIDRVEDELSFPLDAGKYLTLEGLFDVIQGALDAEAESIVVSYDPDWGFPVSIQIDYSASIVDEEVAYTAGDFTPGTGFEPLQAELDAARLLFESTGIVDYDYVMRRGCFCVPEFVAPGRVSVRDEVLVGVEHPDSGEPLNSEWYETLEALFDVIQDAIDEEAAMITVDYDETRGFPESISIDRYENIADDEISYSASEFVPEPGRHLMHVAAIGVLAVLGRMRARRVGAGRRATLAARGVCGAAAR